MTKFKCQIESKVQKVLLHLYQHLIEVSLLKDPEIVRS